MFFSATRPALLAAALAMASASAYADDQGAHAGVPASAAGSPYSGYSAYSNLYFPDTSPVRMSRPVSPPPLQHRERDRERRKH